MTDKAIRAMVFAFRELNEIRARDGIPYTHLGYPSSVSPKWFSEVVNMLDEAVREATGHGAHGHPVLSEKMDEDVGEI